MMKGFGGLEVRNQNFYTSFNLRLRIVVFLLVKLHFLKRCGWLGCACSVVSNLIQRLKMSLLLLLFVCVDEDVVLFLPR